MFSRWFSAQSKRNKALIMMIGVELIVVLIILLYFLRFSISAGNVEKYADTKDIPEITADDGLLIYDNVRVIVPDEDATYVIGYDWAKKDTEYPSIPSSASAYYTDDNEQTRYEVLLYRDKVTPKEKSGKKYTLDMWYDEWEKASKGDSNQKPYKTPDTKGFLIQTGNVEPSEDKSDDNAKDKTEDQSAGTAEDKSQDNSEENSKNGNCSYTYYFAVETDSDIEQFVFELNCYDPDYFDKAEKIFKACADSIHTGSAAHT